ncbi:MAG: hypothetical protein K2L51_03255 [Clostridiales bacterium]|nr:hypothetical protein [Clostridiales bacterium]
MGNSAKDPKNDWVEEVEDTSGHGCLIALIVFVILAVTAAVLVALVRNSYENDGNPSSTTVGKDPKPNTDGILKPFSRSATAADITVTEGELSLSPLGEIYYVVPNVDIKNLKIHIRIFSDTKTLAQKTFTLGDVSKDREYKCTYKLSDLGLGISDIKDIMTSKYYWQCSVTGGTVSYFS